MKLKYLTLLAFVMAIVVVVLGAYTRLVDAGLGCPDWPTCYGHLWVPTTEADIARANEAFQHAPVETHKTWPEQIHRIFASALGLVILTMFGIAAVAQHKQGGAWRSYLALLVLLVVGTIVRIVLGDSFDVPLLLLALVYFSWLALHARDRNNTSTPFKLVTLLAGFVIMQGWFGMWTVTLSLWPQVVTTHLLGGFTTLTLIWLCFQRSASYGWSATMMSERVVNKHLPLLWLLFVLVVMQVALGGWTTSNYAALACPDFPACHAEWWPHADFAQGFNIFQHVGPNYLGGQLDNHARTAIHLSHRIGALLVLIIGTIFILRLWLSNLEPLRRYAFMLALLLITQIGLGITNVVGGLPLAVAVAHNAGGAALLLCVVTLLQRFYSVRADTH